MTSPDRFYDNPRLYPDNRDQKRFLERFHAEKDPHSHVYVTQELRDDLKDEMNKNKDRRAVGRRNLAAEKLALVAITQPDVEQGAMVMYGGLPIIYKTEDDLDECMIEAGEALQRRTEQGRGLTPDGLKKWDEIVALWSRLQPAPVRVYPLDFPGGGIFDNFLEEAEQTTELEPACGIEQEANKTPLRIPIIGRVGGHIESGKLIFTYGSIPDKSV